ncbi:MAG: phasin family protein, partial [Prosthecobacter sp.]|nr:phasin family protein [Prosthecobacter sp.]
MPNKDHSKDDAGKRFNEIEAAAKAQVHSVQTAADETLKAINQPQSKDVAEQSQRNFEAAGKLETILSEAAGDNSQKVLAFLQAQAARQIQGFRRMGEAKTYQEGVSLQSELVREALDDFLSLTRAVTDSS